MSFIEDQQKAWETIVSTLEANPALVMANGGTINGPGSSMAGAGHLVYALPKLLRKYDFQTMIDAACGDLTWIGHTDLRFLRHYIGIDFNRKAIEANKINYADRGYMSFICTNILKRRLFMAVDVILCRDFLAHLPTDYILAVLSNFQKSGSKYLLASQYPGSDNEFTYVPGEFNWEGYMERPYDLTKEPFGLRQVDAIQERPAPKGVISQPHELGLFVLNEGNRNA